LALSRLTFHYKQKWDNICKADVLRSGIGPILIIVGFVGNEFGPNLNKVGTIEHGFVTNFNKVGTIGYPNPTKRAPSMQNLIENSSKWALSEPILNQTLTKWALSGFKSGQVEIIGGGSCPRVDVVRKVGILCGRGVDVQKKWSYCVGVVRVDVTTPTPYGHFFQKYVTLRHHMATLSMAQIMPREDYRRWIVPKAGFGPKSCRIVWE